MKKIYYIGLVGIHILLAGCSLPSNKPVCDQSSLTVDEREAVAKSQIFIGMSEKAFNCSWGFPDPIYGSVNRSVSSSGERKQYVFRQRHGKANYVYVVNGKVSSWSN